MKTLHQFSVGIAPGDAISDEIFTLQRWLNEINIESHIFVDSIHPDCAKDAQYYYQYKPTIEDELVVFHYSIGSEIIDWIIDQPVKIILIYHNITPSEYLSHVSPSIAKNLDKGRKKLKDVLAKTVMAFGKSNYSCQELLAAGFKEVKLLPISIDEERYKISDNLDLIKELKNNYPNLLFVGRMVPNKKQEDMIKLLYHLKQIQPNSKLWLVGANWLPLYDRWLKTLVADLELEDSITFTEHVSQQDMVTYYRYADVFVSMSEHEGFGKPLIESMYFGLPVLAYNSSAVPDTLDGAGILFNHKHFESLAELVNLVYQNKELKDKIVNVQKKTVAKYLDANVRKQWINIVQQLI